MKAIILALMLGTMGMMVGCGSDSETKSYTTADINNYDGTKYGETRNESPVNGSYQIYGFGTGNLVASIGYDSIVSDTSGTVIGTCENTVVSDAGVNGVCTLDGADPLPCPDTRDGTFPQSTVPQVCYDHGYFYCSIAGVCLDKPANVNECGEVGSEQRDSINYP